MTKHSQIKELNHCKEGNCEFKCDSENDLKSHIASSHDSNLCIYCGEAYSSERYLRQHIDDKHIADSATELKRDLSITSKFLPEAKHVKSDQVEEDREGTLMAQVASLNEHVKSLNENITILAKESAEKDHNIHNLSTTVKENEVVIQDLLAQITNLENDAVSMLDTNTQLENEMLEKNTKLENEVKDLKKQMEPEDEVEQLAILMAGKNKSYARTVAGSVPRTKKKQIYEVCHLICETETKYRNHIQSHNADGDWSCVNCDFETNSHQKLSKHKCDVICEWNCVNCNFQTNSQEKLNRHVCKANPNGKKASTNSILNNIKCTVCDDMFPNKTELSTHKFKSHKSWKLCNKFFNTDVQVKCLHNPCHFSHVPPSEGMHRCYDCGREFHVLEELMLHRKKIHNAVC